MAPRGRSRRGPPRKIAYVKRHFRFTKTRHRLAKNLNHLHMPFASADRPMRARAVALAG